MKRRLLGAANAAAVVAVVLGAAMLVLEPGTMRTTPSASTRSSSGTPRGAMPLSSFSALLRGGHWSGLRDARVVVLVYSTYACGYCGNLNSSLAELRSKYPEHLAVVKKHFVKPQRGPELNTALGAECAAHRDRFAAYDSVAFNRQNLAQASNGWREIAEVAGVADTDFMECVLSQARVQVIERHYDEARKIGVTRTPTFFVNGIRVVGAAPTPKIDSLIAGSLRGM